MGCGNGKLFLRGTLGEIARAAIPTVSRVGNSFRQHRVAAARPGPALARFIDLERMPTGTQDIVVGLSVELDVGGHAPFVRKLELMVETDRDRLIAEPG